MSRRMLVSAVAKGFVLSISLVVQTSAVVGAQQPESLGGYRYLNCAEDTMSVLLANCAELTVSSLLSTVRLGKFLEEDLVVDVDKDHFVLRSENVPIAIPKNNYEKSDSWVYSGRKYFKIKKAAETLQASQKSDVIAVVANLEKFGGSDKLQGIDSLDALNNVVLTYWYDPQRGVEAVGVPGRAGEKAVYFCVQRPCLFGKDE